MRVISKTISIGISAATAPIGLIFMMLLLLFIVPSLHSQKSPPSTFEIRPGATMRIASVKELPIEVNYFILGENSTLEIDIFEVSRWRLTAAEAYIGNNVRIVGKQANMPQADNGVNGSNGSADCKAGSGGGKGQDGKDGANGLSLYFTLGIVTFGSLEVDVSGGAGQQGGNGGTGGTGGKADISELCKGGDGGSGGDGGDGAGGGDAGIVEIMWRSVDGGLSEDQIQNRLTSRYLIIADPGAGGAEGNAGPSGHGGASKCTDFALFKICRGSGSAGPKGNRGNPGEDGNSSQQINKIERIRQ